MVQFGVCTPVETSAAVTAAGWDFVEESAQALLQGQVPDAQWGGLARARSSALPIRASNLLVPAALKITGPTARLDDLRAYINAVCRRAPTVGIKFLVFGSGGARNVPDGFSRDVARTQIMDFIKVAGDAAAAAGVTIVVEHLNRRECNIINSVAEAMEYIRAANHPAVQCLVDSFHLWLENESLDVVKAAMPWVRHVHVSDVINRAPPGETGQCDYRPLFGVLKRAGYDAGICVEAIGFTDFATMGPRVLDYLKQQWAQA
jgi:sugar phosphate isomerase/epimerase